MTCARDRSTPIRINPLEILGLIGGVDGGPAVQAPAPSAPGQSGVSPADPGGRFVSPIPAGQRRLEQGDVEEGLNAASQVGDDTMQKRSQGTVVPDAFTHGSSKQRVYWFRVGMESRQLSDCDTFARTEP